MHVKTAWQPLTNHMPQTPCPCILIPCSCRCCTEAHAPVSFVRAHAHGRARCRCPTHSLGGVLGDPVFGNLLKLLGVALVLVGDTSFDGVIGLRSGEDYANEGEDVPDAVWRLPGVAAKDAETHGTLVIVTDVWVVDLGLEADDWRLEGVFLGERDFESELAALWRKVRQEMENGIQEYTHGIDGVGRASQLDFPLEDVVLVGQVNDCAFNR